MAAYSIAMLTPFQEHQAWLAQPDLWGVVANAACDSGNTRFRPGAKVWLILTSGGTFVHKRARFYGMSPGGRMIVCWQALKHFQNYRTAWVPMHLRRMSTFGVLFEKRGEAEQLVRDLIECGCRIAAD